MILFSIKISFCRCFFRRNKREINSIRKWKNRWIRSIASPILFSSSFSVKTLEPNDASKSAKNNFNIYQYRKLESVASRLGSCGSFQIQTRPGPGPGLKKTWTRSFLFTTNFLHRTDYKLRTTRFAMTNVNRKNGIHGHPAHSRHTHIDSIHSPHKTRKTIL